MRKLIMVLMLAAMFAGCVGGASESASVPGGSGGQHLNRIPGTESIEIPQSISNEKALDAVEIAVKGTRPGDRVNHWVSQWRMEARDPANEWIRIGLTARNHYLCVCYRIEGGKLVPDVPTSKNLKQEGTKIHRKVPVWINNLKPLISQRLYDMVNGSSK